MDCSQGAIDFEEYYGFYSRLYTEEANDSFKKWNIALVAAQVPRSPILLVPRSPIKTAIACTSFAHKAAIA